MPQNIDNMTAKTKRFEINEHGVITIKQGGTDFHGWVDKHHIESKKIIDDKIEGVEASLAKGTGNSIQCAETGGRNISPEQFFKEEAIAEEVNGKFRDLGTEDVNAIAKNTGFSVARIQRIKDHVFNNSHIKDHEIFESKFEGIFQTNYRTAHDKTIESGRPWNWEENYEE
ncbi:hypothetical protein WAZ07_19615 [Bacillus sp. FJAT-51639]|uniref:Uncharacterized protein n=1 Tax=Bacillus bruguierae TaxID=3127667 RepID=A0ABU8FNF3_9BACI